MSKLTEAQVEELFAAHLTAQGWEVRLLKEDFIDLYAVRGDQTLIAEIKGHTKSPGAAMDIGYGQLLRRMKSDHDRHTYAIVAPKTLEFHAERVECAVRRTLGIDLYLIDEDGAVEKR